MLSHMQARKGRISQCLVVVEMVLKTVITYVSTDSEILEFPLRLEKCQNQTIVSEFSQHQLGLRANVGIHLKCGVGIAFEVEI